MDAGWWGGLPPGRCGGMRAPRPTLTDKWASAPRGVGDAAPYNAAYSTAAM